MSAQIDLKGVGQVFWVRGDADKQKRDFVALDNVDLTVSAGEFLTLVGSFAVNPWFAVVATFVMILAAAYLLWMYQRVVTGEPSAFLLGLGSHLTDITATEILTLAPLGALVVVLGFFPGILLNLISGPATTALAGVGSASPIAVDPVLVAIGIGIVVAIVVIRLVTLRPAGDASAPGSTSLAVESHS